MNRRPSAPKAVVRRPLSAALAAVAMAMTLCAFPIATAHAEPIKCTPTQAICLGPRPEPTQEPIPSEPPPESPAPAEPEPAPTVPQQPTAAPVAPVATAPPVTTDAEPTPTETSTPTNTPTPIPSSAAPSASSAASSAESNWNEPIRETAKAKQAAVVVGKEGPPTNTFALFSIMGGVLLVGLGGLAFALWSRNKLASH